MGKIYGLLLTLFVSTCYSQTGVVSGNVFWKYNDYVGNRADAGDTVYLISKDHSIPIRSASTDLNGNFKIENVKEGGYLIIIISHNTVGPVTQNLDKINLYRSYYTDANSLLDSVNQTLIDLQTANNAKAKIRDLKKKRKNIDAAEKRYVDALVDLEFKKEFFSSFRLSSSSYTPKLFFKEIHVSPSETANIVADFGNTYQ